MSEYKPPIDVTFRDTIESIEKEWVNGVDNYIVSTVREVTGVDVDKKRLINALMIDKKLVRCKDCRFWGTEQDGYCAAIDDPYMLETEEDDFCSWGEKEMSNCVHDNGEYCEVLSDEEVRQPCLETPLCEDYKEIVRCKDCENWDDVLEGYCTLNDCFDWDADDFCSRGERRDEQD